MSQNHNVEIRITAQNLSSAEFQKVVQDLRGMGTAADVATSELRDVGDAAQRAGNDLRTMDQSASGIVGSLRRIGETAAGVAIGNMLEDAPRQMFEFGKASFNAASDFQESMNKVDVVFGQASDSMVDWSQNAAEAFGLSQSAALEAAGTFGNLFTSMGLGQAAAADMSQGVVQLAADLGSFNNIGTDEALEKLRAGLVGEIEPLRSLGVNLNAATVQAKALEMGLAGTTKELTAADKAQASYALILEQTGNAQGDFARTSESAANSIKTAQASVDELQVALGTGLTPVVATGAQELTTFVSAATEFTAALNQINASAGRLVGGEGPLSSFVDFAMTAEPMGHGIANSFTAVAEGFDWISGSGDDAAASMFQFIEAAADGVRPLNLFQQVLADINAELADTSEIGSEAIALLSRLGNEAEVGGEALDKFGGAHGRAAEMAGLANERNTEFLHTIELGSGRAAEMAFNVAKVAEAQGLLADAYQQGLQAMGLFNQQSSEYAGIQNTLEKGYENILEKQEQGVELTDEEQKLLERYPQLYGRLEGAQKDAETQAALYAAANTEVMLAQDDLNAAIARGEDNLDPYIQRLNDAKALAGDSAYAEPMTQSLNTLTGTITTVLIPAINDMTRKIEYIAKPWLVEIDAATEAAEAELLRILGLINQINSSSAAPYMPGMGDPGGGQAFAEGGIVGKPTFAMIGEDGPELVLPLTKPERMRALLKAAGFPMMADGGGFLGANVPPKGAPAIDISVNVGPIDWSFLFAGLDKAAEDWGQQAGSKFIQFFRGNIEDLASGEMLADAQAELTDLFTIRAIAVESGAIPAVIAEIDAEIAAQQAEVNAIGDAMGTSIVSGIADSLASGEAAALLAEFRQGIFDALDLGDIGDEQGDLAGAIRHLEALRDAAIEIGDQSTADVLTAQLAELQAELALVVQIAGTDAVAAWEAEQAAMQAAAEEAERLQEKHEALLQSYYDIIQAVSEGGDSTANFLTGLVEAAENAQDALDWARLLGLPDEVIAQLEADLAEVSGLLETGSVYLVRALEAGLIDEATLKALAEAGGEWFRAIYDSLFGEGALAEMEAGWVDLSDAAIAKLTELVGQMEDAGASIADTLVEAVASGAMSYEEALGLYSEATGEEVNEILESLQALRDALVVQLFEATAAGATEMAADLAAQLAIVDQLLADLADRAVETTVAMQGFSMAVGSSPGGAASALDELEQAIRDMHEAQREADAAPIIEAWKSGLITLEEAEQRLAALGDGVERVGESASRAGREVSQMSRSLQSLIGSSFIFAGNDYSAFAEGFADGIQADVLERFRQALAIDPEMFEAEYIAAFEATQNALQRALLVGSQETIDRYLAMLETMREVAGMLGIDIGEALGDGIGKGLNGSDGQNLSPVARAKALGKNENWEQGADGVWRYNPHATSSPSPGPSTPTPGAGPTTNIAQALADSAEIQGRIIGAHVERAVEAAMRRALTGAI